MKIPQLVIPDRLGMVIGWTVLIVISPLLAVMAAMIGCVALKRKVVGPTSDWGRWFAWYPVAVAWEWESDTRWLEIVERRSGGIMHNIEYRSVKPSAEGGAA